MKRLMNKTVLTFATIFCISAAVTADTLVLSLNDALTRAMKNNPTVRIEALNTNIAEAILKENKYDYEPTVKFTYNHTENFLDEYSTDAFSASITQTAPTGTKLELFDNASIYKRDYEDYNYKNYQSTAGFTVTQALLEGLRPSVNLVPIRKAKIDIDLAEEELAAVAAKLLLDGERAYWNLYLSGEEVKIYQHSLDLAKQLLSESEERLKTGAIAPIDLAAIKAEVASREKQLFDAQTAYKQNILDIVYIMNAPEYWEAEITLSDTINTLGEADALEDHIKAAQKFRQDFRQAEMLAQKGELDLMQTKNGLLPKLDFFITLQTSSSAETFAKTVFSQEEYYKPTLSLGATLELPVTKGAARQKHNATKYTLEQQQLSIENFSRLMEYEIRSAIMEVSRAAIQIETAKTVTALQQQKMEAEEEKLRVGRSTGYALLQAQRDLVEANLDEARAKSAYSDALLSLFYRDGTLMQRRGIKPAE